MGNNAMDGSCANELDAALVRICEPIAFMSIFPYIYYMILSFKITADDRQIAIYAGMVTSAFAFAEFSTGVLWGRLSDKVGRKPVLIGGLVGTALSMLVFGFAQNLQTALIARALGGLLNGYVKPVTIQYRQILTGNRNIGVLQTTVAEMVTVKEHQRKHYVLVTFSRMLIRL
jgi:MFS family permease